MNKIYKKQAESEIIRIELELTSACNLKCPLCIREVMNLPKKPSYRPLKDIVTQLDSYTNLRHLTIAGAVAEPTLYPELFDLIKYLKRRNIEIELYINGDTKDDLYYKKLGLVCRGMAGGIYFTVCGSTQALHEKYRIGSQLDRVLNRLEITDKFSGGLGVLTWIVFNYNQEDFEKNYHLFVDRYKTVYFHTTPIDEHFNLGKTIHLPDNLRKIYMEKIDRTDLNVAQCQANRYRFLTISYEGQTNPCSLYRMYGETHCWECSQNNVNILRSMKVYAVPEPESEESGLDLRLYYDSNPSQISDRRNRDGSDRSLQS